MSDWINDFVTFTEGVASPPLFRQWAAICAVGAALEQRVWALAARTKIYPNLYCILCGPPGVGKSTAINPVERFWRGTGALCISPSSVTRAALADTLMGGSRHIVTPEGELLDYHSVQVCSAEFANFISNDMDFMALLNHVYDNPPIYDEGRRTVEKKDLPNLVNPQLSILAGTTPGFLADLLPDGAWAQGFPSRLAMIFCPSGPQVELFGHYDPRAEMDISLQKRLTDLTAITGQVGWTPEAITILKPWHKDGMKPVPSHPKLAHYVPRRILQILKLCIISSASRGDARSITGFDATRAMGWLLDAEERMPDIFLSVSHNGDGTIMREVHMWMWGMWAKDKAPIPRGLVVRWLSNKVPSYRIDSLVSVMLSSGAMSSLGPDQFVPRPWDTGATVFLKNGGPHP